MSNEPLLRRAVLGLLGALPLWAWVFRGRRWNFWTRMTLGAGSLGLYALTTRPELRKEIPKARDILPGALSAAGLYAIFQVGDRLARRVMPGGQEDIESVYALRTLAPKAITASLLVSVIGPSEELFWRGRSTSTPVIADSSSGVSARCAANSSRSCAPTPARRRATSTPAAWRATCSRSGRHSGRSPITTACSRPTTTPNARYAAP